MRILSGAWPHSSSKSGLEPVLPHKKADTFQSAQSALGTPYAAQPRDTICFSGSSEKAPVSPERQAVLRLEIPYQFKFFRRQKDDQQNVARHYMPRTVKPENLSSHLQGAQLIALGDLHGSYQKLVETLLATGLATMPPTSAKSFREISEALAQDILTEPNYPSGANPFRRYVTARINGNPPERALRLLKMAAFSQETIDDITQRQKRYQGYYQQLRPLIQQLRWTGADGQQLLLIGDVLSDRGALDFLTLDVIEQITRDNPKRLITLASNHDHAGMHTLIYNMFPMGWNTAASLGRSVLMSSEGQPQVRVSIHPEGETVRLALSSAWNPGSMKDLRERYHRYVQASQLVHYRPESQTLFAHAPINTTEVSRLNDVLSQRYLECASVPQTDSKSGRARLSDVGFWQSWANRFWQSYAGKAFEENSLKTPVEELLESIDPEQGFLWRRDALKEEASLPFFNNGVQMLVHGHDRGSIDSPFSVHHQWSAPAGKAPYSVVNLDQDTRKTLQRVGNHPDCTLYVEF